MFKWEQKLTEIIDKKLPLLAFFIVTLSAFYMRRAGYWYSSFDLQNHFYPELLTYLHTPFYTLLIKMLPAISITPVQQVKILVCLFDLAAALGAVQLLKETGRSDSRTALLACFTLLLVSPLTIESGLLWIHVDSLCMSAFLWAMVLYKRKRSVPAGILAGIGAALLTQYALLLLLPVLFAYKKTPELSSSERSEIKLPPRRFLFPCTALITGLILNAAAVGILDTDWRTGLFGLVNWLLISPESGTVFSGFISWLKTMPAYLGYMIGTLSLLTAFMKPKYRVPAAVIHVLLLLYIGHILQQGW